MLISNRQEEIDCRRIVSSLCLRQQIFCYLGVEDDSFAGEAAESSPPIACQKVTARTICAIALNPESPGEVK